jgi:two-component system cell cycle response regulator
MRWKLTRSTFVDFAIYFSGFGILIGLVFPYLVSAIGIPHRYTMAGGFRLGAVSAGLVVGVLGASVAARLLGKRLGILADALAKVADTVDESIRGGKACDVQSCSVAIDTSDVVSRVASEFNRLIAELIEQHRLRAGLDRAIGILTEHMEVDDLIEALLNEIGLELAPVAASYLEMEGGKLTARVTNDLITDPNAIDHRIVRSLQTDRLEVLELPEGVKVTAPGIEFVPRYLVFLPLVFKGAGIGELVLAFGKALGDLELAYLEGIRRALTVAVNNAMSYERYQRLAAIDPLTGIFNRRFGMTRLGEEFNRAIRTKSPLGVLIFDLDHFKAVNDTHGHPVGDQILVMATAAALECLREGDILARIGGEEFMGVIPGANVGDAMDVGERIRARVGASYVDLGAGRISVTISVGVASYPHCPVGSAEELLTLADQALYRSKLSGRDRVSLARPRIERPSSLTPGS